jgi:isopentenyl diphosphate isomerase/L-lactate dehydrogenase-like FMN-dependent dehydrogenase
VLTIEEVSREIRVCMFMAGAGSLEALGEVDLTTDTQSSQK